jgi:putative spermidine/putrescine transport system permease protein
MHGRGTRIGLRFWIGLVLAFLYVPLVIIMVYAFNKSNVQSWPIAGVTTKWFHIAWDNQEVRNALVLSVKVATLTMGAALLLGSAAAFAIHRFSFFGRDVVSFVVVLPIALPGIITGMALNRFFLDNPVHHLTPSLWTIVIGHTTFCIVIIYNNLLARLRRTPTSLVEASQDLGADGWQTFRFVTLPMVATALVAGALLAFALSFDEVVVTFFTAGAQNTLPLLIFGYIRQGQQLPVVNVIVFVVILLTIVPVAIAQRLTRDTGVLRPGAAAAAAAAQP